jgi:hypothetical protein
MLQQRPTFMMPTKRRILIFLIVLAMMMTAKYVWGQDAAEQTVGWDPVSVTDDSIAYLYLVIVGGPVVGLIAGLARVCSRNLATNAGRLHTRQLVLISISKVD